MDGVIRVRTNTGRELLFPLEHGAATVLAGALRSWVAEEGASTPEAIILIENGTRLQDSDVVGVGGVVHAVYRLYCDASLSG
jgi:hypothetical protein